MKFIKFGVSDEYDAVTIYPAHRINSIVLYDQHVEDGDTDPFKILLFLDDEPRGVAECFYYEGDKDKDAAQDMARKRFDEILAQLNG